ncbi:hypothetical protein XENTR_v10019190 [Xenopus tropicalis]|nr:hypothetical protein XENTR_v10019190 [Xenopus tropicalis]
MGFILLLSLTMNTNPPFSIPPQPQICPNLLSLPSPSSQCLPFKTIILARSFFFSLRAQPLPWPAPSHAPTFPSLFYPPSKRFSPESNSCFNCCGQ